MNSAKEGSLKEEKEDSGTGGGYICKSMRTKDVLEKNNKLKYDQAIKQLIAENEERKRKAKNPRKKKNPQGERRGDKLSLDNNWLGKIEQKTIQSIQAWRDSVSSKRKLGWKGDKTRTG